MLVTGGSQGALGINPWLLSGGAAENAGWRPGGEGTIAANRDLNRGYVLMHQGGVDTHHESGTELWVFDIGRKELTARWALEEPWSYILALHTDSRLIVGATDSDTLEIHDGETGEHVRTIAEPGRSVYVLQEFSSND